MPKPNKKRSRGYHLPPAVLQAQRAAASRAVPCRIISGAATAIYMTAKFRRLNAVPADKAHWYSGLRQFVRYPKAQLV
ncbi:MAG: hypothetical protein MUF19_01535 [Candidatus Pacebacteria bacterium]|nr:hypothetical protein [Candidatus Paceibacterota bacterium]